MSWVVPQPKLWFVWRKGSQEGERRKTTKWQFAEGRKLNPRSKQANESNNPEAKKSNVSLDQTKARSQETKEVKPFNEWKKWEKLPQKSRKKTGFGNHTTKGEEATKLPAKISYLVLYLAQYLSILDQKHKKPKKPKKKQQKKKPKKS